MTNKELLELAAKAAGMANTEFQPSIDFAEGTHALYCTADVEKLTAERDQARKNESAIRTLMECYQLGGCTDHERLARNLAASQAREQQLREALKVVEQTLTYGQSYTVNAALALPQDDTALRQYVRSEQAKLLREMAEHFKEHGYLLLRHKADELGEGK